MKVKFIFLALISLNIFFFIGLLYVGDFHPQISLKGIIFTNTTESYIFYEVRFLKALTAFLSGTSLGLSGLLMQVLFRNPLAGPYVLGIQGGAAFMVAIGLILPLGLVGKSSVSTLSFVGCFATFLLLGLFSRFSRHSSILLIVGFLLSHFFGAMTTILMSFSRAQALKSFFVWNLGDFTRTSGRELLVWAIFFGVILSLSILFRKQFSIFTLGDNKMRVLGGNPGPIRLLLILISSLLSSIVITLCGPISFVGLIAPHLFILAIGRYSLSLALFGAALTGSLVALCGQLIVELAPVGQIPLNSVLGLIGVPLIFYILIKGKKDFHHA